MNSSDARLIEYIRGEQSNAQLGARQYYEPEWQDLITLYMNYAKTDMPPGAEWVRDDMIADGFRIIESTVPHQVMAKYQNPRFYSVVTPTRKGDAAKEAARLYLDSELRQSHYVERSVPAIRMNQILGHGIQKTVWVNDWGTKDVRTVVVEQGPDGQPIEQQQIVAQEALLYHGAWIEWLDLMNVWKSLQVDRFGNPLWWLQSIDTSIEQIKAEDEKFKRYGGLYHKKALKELSTTLSTQPIGQNNGQYASWEVAGFGAGGTYDQQNLQDWVSGISRTQRRDKNSVVRWEWWGYIPKSVRDYGEEGQFRLIEIANADILLRDVRAPIPSQCAGSLPFKDLFAIRVGDEPYGRAPLRWAMGEIDQRSTLRNLRLAGAFSHLFPTFILDMDADFDSFDMHRLPGGYWPVHANGQGVNKVVEMVPDRPIFQDAYAEDSLMEAHLLKVAGATDPFQGAFASKRMQATEFEGTVKLGGVRHQLMVMLNDLQSTHDYLTKAFKYAQLYLEEPRPITMQTGEQGEIDWRDLQFDVDIYIDGGEFGNLDANRLQALVQFVLPMLQDPDVRIEKDLGKIVNDVLYYAGFPRSDMYDRPREEVERAKQQQMAMAMAQAQGQGQQR